MYYNSQSVQGQKHPLFFLDEFDRSFPHHPIVVNNHSGDTLTVQLRIWHYNGLMQKNSCILYIEHLHQ